jgi:hypothetical protein
MADRRVSIRMGITGEADVTRAFNQVAQAGEGASRRLGRALERDLADAEAGQLRVARTMAKINAIMPQTAMQLRVDGAAGTGFGEYEGSARRSAAAMAALFAEQAKVEAGAKALLASIDPVVAAQQRYDAEMERARTLISKGAISLDDYCAKLRQEEAALEAVRTAQVAGTTTSGRHAAAMQNVSYQVQDAFVQLQAGTPIITVATQQGTQMAAAMHGMGGAAGKFAAFMSGPWGLALTGGVIVAGMLISKLTEGSDALRKETRELEQNEAKARIAEQAKQAFARSEAGTLASVRALTEELKKQNGELLTNAERMNIRAKQDLEKLQASRGDAAKDLGNARSALTAAESPLAMYARPEDQIAAIAAAEQRVRKEEERLRNLDAGITAARVAIQRSRVDLAAEAAKTLLDPIEKVKRGYDDQIAAIIRRQRADADAGKQIDASLTRRLALLQQEKDAAVAAEQKKQEELGKTAQQLGRVVTLAEARAIAEGIGGRVTNDFRTRSQQQRIWDAKQAGLHAGPVARPGTSLHEQGRALDVAYGPGISVASLRQAYAARGVALQRILDEPAQRIFHVELAKRASAESQLADEMDRQAKAERERAQELTELTGRFDPAAAAAERYRVTLAKIGELKPANDNALRTGAWAEFVRARADAFTLPVIGDFAPDQAAEDERLERERAAAERRAEFVRSTFADQADSLALAERELALVGRSDQARQAEIAKLEMILRLKRGTVDATSAEGQAILANQERLDAMADLLRRQQDAWATLHQIGGDALDRLLDPSSAETWGDRVMGVIGEIQNELVKLALTNPIKNALFGQSNQTFAGIASIFGGGSWWNPGSSQSSSWYAGPGAAAVGTEWATGGRTLVGENGAEIVDMPRGAKVYPAAETRRMLAANDRLPALSIDASIHAPGADAAALARVEAAQRQMMEQLPGRIVAVVNEGLERRVIG